MGTQKQSAQMSSGDKAMIRMIMGRVHVGTPDGEVAREWNERAAAYDRSTRKAVMRYALKVHHQNGTLYHRVMTGKL